MRLGQGAWRSLDEVKQSPSKAEALIRAEEFAATSLNSVNPTLEFIDHVLESQFVTRARSDVNLKPDTGS
jgi:hypothetical protein